jgi:hypothetical protein
MEKYTLREGCRPVYELFSNGFADSVHSDEKAAAMGILGAVFSDVFGSWKCSENTAELSVFRE